MTSARRQTGPAKLHIGFPLYGPKTFHPNIISSKLSVYRNPLLDVQTLSCIWLYTAVYRLFGIYNIQLNHFVINVNIKQLENEV